MRFTKVLAGMVVLSSSFAWAADSVLDGQHTEPSKHPKMSLAAPGIVSAIPVKRGQVVHKGDVLLQEDDRMERAQLESLRGEAFSGLNVKYYQADYAYKQAKYEKLRDLHDKENGAASVQEVKEAQLDADEAFIRIDIEKQNLVQKAKEFERQQIKVDQMAMRAPFDGVVEKIDVEVGETVDPAKPAVTMAVNEPLWVRLQSLPTDQAQKVKVGDVFEVTYADGGAAQPATVIARIPVADRASETQEVILELKNPQERDAGLKVSVKLPERIAGTSVEAQTAAAK
jgi:membrane fusion protein, multidrug efflux system